MTAKKTDNHNLGAKLALREYFLGKYHGSGAHVLDCCQGDQVIWSALRKKFRIQTYWGLDKKPKVGRLKLDSVRVLEQPGWTQDVVDIDTYGSPWKHWSAMLPHVVRPMSVFLTIGQWQMGTDSKILECLGLGELKVPQGIACQLHEMAIAYLLTRDERVRS